MSQQDIIRAWKDPEFRESLSEEQRSQIPENPVGIIELTDPEIQAAVGGLAVGGLAVGGLAVGGHCADTDGGCCTGDYNCPFSSHGSGCAGTDNACSIKAFSL